ncbi:MAG: M24 family metallopeptidase [Candidatus Malihini olakiniferum]
MFDDCSISDWSRLLEPSMVLTVEPELYIAPDAKVLYHSIGIRIEDNVLITHSGNEKLTAGSVKDADKEWCRSEQHDTQRGII